MSVKALVIDDEEDYRIIMKEVLGGAGYDVRTVADGLQGLEALRKDPFDVVLVDWMMPKMDGESFCRAKNEDQKLRDIPVIMLTVRQTADEELEAHHFGVDAFIVKPFKAPELLARLRAVLRRSDNSRA